MLIQCAAVARYQEVAESLRERIAADEFPVGSTLPSVAELMRHYESGSVNTIRRAERVLIDEGILESQPGVGVFVLALTSTVEAPRSSMVADLKSARSAIDRTIAYLQRHANDQDGQDQPGHA